MEKDKDFKRIAHDFQKNFSNILSRIVEIANNNISQNFLNSGEIITNNILEAEMKTSNLSGIEIDSNITRKQIKLKSGMINVNERLINSISNINRRTLPLIQNLISFKTNILNNVLSCKMYTTNYPLLITHIINEAKMYYNLLNKIEKKEPFDRNYIYEQEIFWNNIMKEHAEFIRGLLNPTEKELIKQANKYAEEYETIIEQFNNYQPNLKNSR